MDTQEFKILVDNMNKECRAGGKWEYDSFHSLDDVDIVSPYSRSGCAEMYSICDNCEKNITKCRLYICGLEKRNDMINDIKELEKIRDEILFKLEEVSLRLNIMKSKLR